MARHDVSGRDPVEPSRSRVQGSRTAIGVRPIGTLVVAAFLWAGPDLGAAAPSRVQAQETTDGAIRGGRGSSTPAVDNEAGAPAEGSQAAERPGMPRVSGDESFLSWMARASGPIGWVIAAMSFYLFALIVWMALRYRTSIAIPRTLTRELGQLLEQKKYSEAYHRLIADESLLARILTAGVRKLPLGLPMAQRAMELANEDATMEMEHRTTYLATVGTLGPMIGLVGTVYGMIMAFRVIALEGSSPQASDLAKGISTALFATLEGIAISIPAIFFYSFFRNRIARLSLEVAMGAEPLLEQFVPGVRAQEPGPSASAPPPQPPVPMPMGGPASHPHPFAVSAAMAAGPRSALPPVSSEMP